MKVKMKAHRYRTATLAALLGLLACAPAPAPAQEEAATPERPVRLDTVPDWQQEVHYTIEAALDEEAELLRGAATLEYRNASPDTLGRIFVHLYLNAFRPGSRWARTERREQFDFAALEEPDYGFERLQAVRVGGADGAEIEPEYPLAPDSTVVALPLPEALAPGGDVALHLEWTARPSTLCRRQCRRGRSWDLAQWYPRLAVYDQDGWQAHPLLPQGEFYGEFGTYDVTLDLAEDQVVGATGVPVEGDPGWEPAPGSPRSEPLMQRDWYEDPHRGPAPGLLRGAAEPGRKRVRFYAERVHHFGWSASPEYTYEGGAFDPGTGREAAVHVLYRPGDSTWAGGTAVERTITALAWLSDLFGPYPWPQLTNLHRLESGGTEFPMVIMNGSASQGLITHESTHQYAHGILANNEWRDAWLDEGLTSFLDGWFAEDQGEVTAERRARMLEGLGRQEAILTRRPPADSLPPQAREYLLEGDTLPEPLPVATAAEEFAHYGQYGAMSYSKPAVVFHMLRELVGEDAMRRILREYYDRYAFRHVNEAAFREAAEAVTDRELDWFFDQWLHTTATLDYGLGEVTTEETDEGTWRTRVEVIREGEAWMPVTLRVGGETRTLESPERRQVVEVVTDERPEAAVLDPEAALLDIDRSDNRAEVEAPGAR